MEKNENYKEPLYENLKLFKGLELVYRHPCIHYRSNENMECANCKYGLNNNCVIHNEYLKIKKNLEDYEELKKIMGTPIQELMKELKNLQTLKSFINNYLQFQLVYDDIDHYEIIPVKQYIGNSGCLLLTEDKMKKILDICND